MGALYKCQTTYQCSESLIDLIISSAILYYFILKTKIMFENNNGILLLIDQTLCVIGTIQMALQVFYFAIAKSIIWLISLKSIGLVLELLICIILISVIVNKEKHEQLFNIGRLGLCLIGFLWLYQSISHYQESVYIILSVQCDFEPDYVFHWFDVVNRSICYWILVRSSLTSIQGVLSIITPYQKLDNKNDSFSHQLLKLETRLTQIKILKISGLIQYGVQFSLDVFVYALSSNTIEGTNYLIPTSILTVLIYSLLKLISLTTIPVAVFLVCYECNKEYFGTDHHIWNFPNSQRTLKALADNEQLNYVEMSEVK
ncbi:unnamed protein product [Paramecium octaurelia]|uniref:Transmembrane protein n=1 Tax=Paramecium octaurelia TaxID=43137 RepID=A0A8S1V3T6_PAROT|nr:unnamed protein product [Paramecium octaurelia]